MTTEHNNVRETLKILADNVRTRRAALAITQEQLAELAGLSHNYVARIELGLRQPSIGTLTALADALGAQVADLFTRADRKRTTAPTTRTHYLETALADLCAEDNELVVQMLTALVRRLREKGRTSP